MDNRLRTDDETDSDISDLEELDLKLPDTANAKKIKWRQTICYYLSYVSEGMLQNPTEPVIRKDPDQPKSYKFNLAYNRPYNDVINLFELIK